MILLIALLVALIIYVLLVQFKVAGPGQDKAHLGSELLHEGAGEQAQKMDIFSVALGKGWTPLSKKYKEYDQRISAANIRKRLIRAGSPMGALEFLTLKAILTVLVPVLSLIFLGNFVSKEILLIVSAAIGFFLPDIWLNGKIKKRQHNIRKELPNIIDLLNLCVSGGLDFMLAVSRILKDLKTTDLTKELGEVYRETQMGKARRDALKDFAWRVDIPEVHSFVRTLVQADRMGTPMSEALKLQSEEIRVKRFQRGEEMALKAPIKLLFPLFAFILPVVLVIVGGPIMLQFMRGNMSFGGF